MPTPLRATPIIPLGKEQKTQLSHYRNYVRHTPIEHADSLNILIAAFKIEPAADIRPGG